jgi:outer membrane lipoprotein
MKRALTILSVALILTACAPVLNRELMREGTRDVSMDRLRDAPDDYKGKLFILGGVIVNSRFIETGTQIEALYVPVDSSGNLKEGAQEGGRFLAISPKSRGLLDPVVYRRGREITLAGEFLKVRKGKIDDMEYVYPVFEIKQIYLWTEPRYYYVPYYYPYYYNYPFMYDPWGRPYPYPYWPPPPW